MPEYISLETLLTPYEGMDRDRLKLELLETETSIIEKQGDVSFLTDKMYLELRRKYDHYEARYRAKTSDELEDVRHELETLRMQRLALLYKIERQ